MQIIIAAFAVGLLFFQSTGQGKKTDRDFDELNGQVRFVRVEVEEYLDQPGAPGTDTRSLEWIVAYDVSGRATEAFRGSGKDCVSSHYLYSYDDEGNRTQAIYPGNVSITGGKSDPSQPSASPQVYRQVFKTDRAGRRSGIDEYDTKGKLTGKSYYKYDEKGLLDEIIQENYENYSTPSRCEFKYNEKGVARERTCQDWYFRGRERAQYAHEYDARGNWIRRTAKTSRVLPDGSVLESTRIYYREFQFYPSKDAQPQPQPVAERFDATKLANCPAPKIVRKGGGVFQGSATRRVEPKYPQDARKARIFGSVVVEVTVNEAGKVISARPLSGPAELREAAVDAARRWEFMPTKLSGIPVKVIGTITFNFNP